MFDSLAGVVDPVENEKVSLSDVADVVLGVSGSIVAPLVVVP